MKNHFILLFIIFSFSFNGVFLSAQVKEKPISKKYFVKKIGKDTYQVTIGKAFLRPPSKQEVVVIMCDSKRIVSEIIQTREGDFSIRVEGKKVKHKKIKDKHKEFFIYQFKYEGECHLEYSEVTYQPHIYLGCTSVVGEDDFFYEDISHTPQFTKNMVTNLNKKVRPKERLEKNQNILLESFPKLNPSIRDSVIVAIDYLPVKEGKDEIKIGYDGAFLKFHRILSFNNEKEEFISNLPRPKMDSEGKGPSEPTIIIEGFSDNSYKEIRFKYENKSRISKEKHLYVVFKRLKNEGDQTRVSATIKLGKNKKGGNYEIDIKMTAPHDPILISSIPRKINIRNLDHPEEFQQLHNKDVREIRFKAEMINKSGDEEKEIGGGAKATSAQLIIELPKELKRQGFFNEIVEIPIGNRLTRNQESPTKNEYKIIENENLIIFEFHGIEIHDASNKLVKKYADSLSVGVVYFTLFVKDKIQNKNFEIRAQSIFNPSDVEESARKKAIEDLKKKGITKQKKKEKFIKKAIEDAIEDASDKDSHTIKIKSPISIHPKLILQSNTLNGYKTIKENNFKGGIGLTISRKNLGVRRPHLEWGIHFLTDRFKEPITNLNTQDYYVNANVLIRYHLFKIISFGAGAQALEYKLNNSNDTIDFDSERLNKKVYAIGDVNFGSIQKGPSIGLRYLHHSKNDNSLEAYFIWRFYKTRIKRKL